VQNHSTIFTTHQLIIIIIGICAVGSQPVNKYWIELDGYKDDEAEIKRDQMHGVFRAHETDKRVLIGKLKKQDNSGHKGAHGRLALNWNQ
jgi:hypothetical protein